MILKRVVFLCSLLVLAVIVVPFHVNADSGIIRVPADYAKIQDAINNASLGDSVQVSPGTYYENLFIGKNLTLVGENKDDTILDGDGGTGIQANSTCVSISSFTLVHARFGIILENCTGSTVAENNIKGCDVLGIWLHYSNSNVVSDNHVSNTVYDSGIVLCGHSSKNVLARNTLENDAAGMAFTGMDNLIYHNNFLNNQNQTRMIESFSNAWNNTCEGNYWSNYNGTDTNGNGIGDTPYTIDANNIDNYPLMSLYWSPCDINHDLKVNMRDIGKSAVAFGTRPGDAMWNPHADITGPEPLVPDGKVNMQDIALVAKHFGQNY